MMESFVSDPKYVGQRIYRARCKRRLAQFQLAARLGVRPLFIERLERGDISDAELSGWIEDIARVLNVTSHWLMTGEEDGKE
ncbi:hypothetical protein ES703_28424 [subsurface metagenome]